MIVKLISPISIAIDIEGESYPVSTSAAEYINDIQAAIHREMIDYNDEEFLCKGLAAYFDEGSLLEKCVKTAIVSVKEIEDKIMAVCYCVIPDEIRKDNKLFEKIIEELKEEITGQYSDGWGEGFEQRPIKVDHQELYVSFWSYNNWYIEAEIPTTMTLDSIANGLESLLEKIKDIVD